MGAIGVLLTLAGIFVMLQSRIPIEKRLVRVGKSGRGPTLDKRQCIRGGGIFTIAGVVVALEGFGVHIETPHVSVAVGAAMALIYFSADARD